MGLTFRVDVSNVILPNSRKSLLDSEFADDTMLYLQGNEENLERAQSAIDLFCKASGASINWNKSKGFWISSESNPLWKPNAEFKWIAKGEATRYLGVGRSEEGKWESKVGSESERINI